MQKRDKLLEKVKNGKVTIVTGDQLNEILDAYEIIREEDTYLSDKIRLLKRGKQFLVQEKSTRQELLLRGFPTEQAAHDFINQRQETYENMWNGCGCKVNYYQ